MFFPQQFIVYSMVFINFFQINPLFNSHKQRYTDRCNAHYTSEYATSSGENKMNKDIK